MAGDQGEHPESVRWSVVCDGAGCRRRHSVVDVPGTPDREVIESVIAHAQAAGWQIEPDRFIRQREDLCPSCCKAKQ